MTTARTCYYSLDKDAQLAMLTACGGKAFALEQIDRWVFQRQLFDFADMTDLSLPLRKSLDENVRIICADILKERIADDKTRKLLLAFDENIQAECVAIPARKRLTFCISTMAGCPAGCVFCASGQGGLQRKLTQGEMLNQYLLLMAAMRKPATNIVLMGMGEPLLNYDAVLGFIRMLNDPTRAALGARRITVSTIGIPDQIIRLADEGIQVELAFSLHHPDDEIRKQLIPIASRYPLAGIAEALQYYHEQTGRKITLEYCLLAGINDSIQCARNTAALARRLRARVNLIPYNVHAGQYTAPPRNEIEAFQLVLTRAGITATIRSSRGRDIEAACGQLAGKNRAKRG